MTATPDEGVAAIVGPDPDCPTCEGDGVVAVNFGLDSRGPCGIKRCPTCASPREAPNAR